MFRKLISFLRQNRAFVIIHFLIIPSLALLTFLSILPYQWLAIIIVVLEMLYNWESLADRWESSKNRVEVKARTDSFNSELRSFESMFVGEFLDLSEIGGENLIEYARETVPDNDQVRLALLYLYLKDMSDHQLKNHEIATLSNDLRRILHEFSLIEPTESDKRLAWGAYQLLCCNSEKVDLSPPESDFMKDECFQNKFIHRYVHKEQVISKLTVEQSELEEYRDTLSTLFDDGELNQYGLHQLLTDLGSEEDLSVVRTENTHFFIMMNELQRGSDIKENIMSAIEAEGHSTHSGTLRLSGGIYSIILSICESKMSTKEFYSRFIEEFYEEIDEDGWLSVHRAKFEGEAMLKKRYRTKEPSKNALEGMAKQNLFTTGQEVETIKRHGKVIESHLTTDELLSVLPLNIFLPSISYEKKKILIENNEEIKEEFGIERLTDWAYANYTPEEIGKYLYHNFFPNDSEKYWVRNVKRIVKKSKEVNKALSRSSASVESGEVSLVPYSE